MAGTNRQTSTENTLEKTVFFTSIVLALCLALIFVLTPDFAAEKANDAMGFITHYFGWLYLTMGMAAIGFGLWLAFGRFGSVKLGDPDEAPEYSTPHWVAMMFTAGIGAGLVTWGFVEPIYYLQTPPLGIEPHSNEAFEWAHMYPLFHWGIVPWAFYAIPAVPIAYSLYVKKHTVFRISESCNAALPKTGRHGLKNIIDVFIILGLLGGTATSLGLGVPLVSALVSELLGIVDTTLVKFAVLGFWVLLFGTSTWRGLKKGIQVLADINMALAGIIIIFVLLAGPTIFILKITVNSFGLMFDNAVRASL